MIRPPAQSLRPYRLPHLGWLGLLLIAAQLAIPLLAFVHERTAHAETHRLADVEHDVDHDIDHDSQTPHHHRHAPHSDAAGKCAVCLSLVQCRDVSAVGTPTSLCLIHDLAWTVPAPLRTLCPQAFNAHTWHSRGPPIGAAVG